MELTKNTELTLKVVCIIILIAINLAVYFNGRNLSCDKCSIDFHSYRSSDINDPNTDNIYQSFSVNITDLFKSYPDCIVTYTDQGYSYDYRKVKQDL